MKLFFAVIFALVGLTAAEQTTTPTKPSIFDTQKACDAALASKDFAYYVPVFTGDKAKDPIDDIKVFGVKLEADQCRHQYTVKGWKYVVQADGTLMRARKDASGELVIFARNDCGNADDTPAPSQPVAVATTTPTPTTTTAREVNLNVHVDGEVQVVHSGTVDLRHTGEIAVNSAGWRQNAIAEPPETKKGGCGRGCKIGIGVGIGVGIAAGVIFGTRGHGGSHTPTGVEPGGVTGPYF